MSLDNEDNPLAREIQLESAQTYFAACKKMVAALDALRDWRPEQGVDRTGLLAEAAERVYFVVIQRDAMKLSGGDKFFEDYDIPEEVKSRIGSKRN